MIINNTNQQDKINFVKKQMQTINKTTQNWLKVKNKKIIHEEFSLYESIIINHKNQQPTYSENQAGVHQPPRWGFLSSQPNHLRDT